MAPDCTCERCATPTRSRRGKRSDEPPIGNGQSEAEASPDPYTRPPTLGPMTDEATEGVTLPADIDPARFATHFASPRGFDHAYVHEGIGGVPIVCVHGWPETKRIFWKVIEPLAAAGF